MSRLLTYLLLTLLIGFVVVRLSVPFLSPKPDDLGTANARLSPCPDHPNCVSSLAANAQNRIEPLAFSGTLAETRAALVDALRQLPRTEIVSSEPDYVHAVSRSRIMGYLDDNEFLLDEQAGVVHVRAAARLGRSDLGANRARLERIRQMLNR